MLRKMEARDLSGIRTMWSSVTSGLEEHGFEVETLDWVDPLGGPTKWVMARK